MFNDGVLPIEAWDMVKNVRNMDYSKKSQTCGQLHKSNFCSTSQISLILEYCSRGNLRAYLIDHESEFMSSLKYYKDNDFVEPLKISEVEDTSNDVFLLHRWSYQVNFVAFYNNLDVKIFGPCVSERH